MKKRWVLRPEGSNWGEFGADDQIGKMNLLTPARRLQAIREVSEGVAIPLSLPLDYPGGSSLAPMRKPPRMFTELRDGERFYNYRMSCICSDYVDICSDDGVVLHTQYSTQWDSLSHWGAEFDLHDTGLPVPCYYNGFVAGADVAPPDADGSMAREPKLGIDNLALAAPQGRGVLVDLQRIHGNRRVAVGYEELMRVMKDQDAQVEPGDILCIYTGWSDALLAMGGQPDAEALKFGIGAVLDGWDPELLEWIDKSGLVAICADNYAVEAVQRAGAPTGRKRSSLPLHHHCIFKLGIHLGELWYFAELAAWLRSRKRTRFFLTAPPLRLPGAAGSPLTPIATV